MDFDAFTQNLAEAIDGLDAASLTADTPLATLPQWDSLAVLTTIAMCDMEYGVSLSATEIQGCATVGALHQLVSGKA